jgi:uncharacterized protein (DUF1501 family)
VQADPAAARGALAHVQRVEQDIARAATRLQPQPLATEFPRSRFGAIAQQGAMLAAGRELALLRLTLPGFDTHFQQRGAQDGLLTQLAEGVAALRAGLLEAGLWPDTLVLTYSEFGRCPRENDNGGTDHGTTNVHFAFGPRVRGGVHGAVPELDRLDAEGNLPFAIDFRALYAEVLQRWWQIDSASALGRRFAPVGFIKA